MSAGSQWIDAWAPEIDIVDTRRRLDYQRTLLSRLRGHDVDAKDYRAVLLVAKALGTLADKLLGELEKQRGGQ